MDGLLGKKLGMTQIFDEAGKVFPVTVVEAGPCYVTQIKTDVDDGYSAIQLGYDDKKEKHTTNPMKGHFQKAGVQSKRLLREFRVENTEDVELGQAFGPDVFEVGDVINVTGTSKGKGFQGVVKRYNFAGGPKTRGQSNRWRAPGSIGQSASPSKVFKGHKMGGRMGNDRVTVKNLTVVGVDTERNLLLIEGAVPGHNDGYVMIRRA
jgi:large subunit ribosomal protein L3